MTTKPAWQYFAAWFLDDGDGRHGPLFRKNVHGPEIEALTWHSGWRSDPGALDIYYDDVIFLLSEEEARAHAAAAGVAWRPEEPEPDKYAWQPGMQPRSTRPACCTATR